MIEQSALVVRLGDGVAWLEVQRQSACTQCSAQNGCGTSVLGKFFSRRRQLVRATNSLPVNVGDRVIVGVDEHSLVQGAFMVYMLPLILLFLGALAADQWYFTQEMLHSDFAAITGAIVGFLTGLVLVRRFGQRVRADHRFQATVLRLEMRGLPVSIA